MLLGQRGAARGDRSGDAGGEAADDVGVALADDDLAGRDDVLLRPVERVQRPSLGIDRRLRGVLVLGLRAAVFPLPATGARTAVRRRRSTGRPSRQDPAAEGDRSTRRVADREDHPAPERVLGPATAVDEAEPAVGHDPLGQLQRFHQRVPVVRRPAEPELPDDVAVVAAGSQVVAGHAGVGRRRAVAGGTSRRPAPWRRGARSAACGRPRPGRPRG